MMHYKRKTRTYTATTFDELVDFGKASGVPLVNGMPWSFTFQGHPVSHENDSCYLVEGYHLKPGELLVLNDGGHEVEIYEPEQFAAEFDVVAE